MHFELVAGAGFDLRPLGYEGKFVVEWPVREMTELPSR